ncbi:GDSL-type esterase/lipase family protein [Cytophagaceae bacterium DM2B3-1]|uniref:GDSL-type esterase/lipase family protein n=1 Tax=Xanthocytophaga flava TaxID=3048013 RepID=A0ABT7CHX6_9BACT|nr:GDSL-type esterase/lipase family protein [Xanthocytophaga flavus]MDJ1466609.1 GDSL-type esterase/lipase family protein [Xanthocytophaga flavus]MDJ1492605.1 GDSL-type esterase/lipase family protein [Xanthocytophaga flavus]
MKRRDFIERSLATIPFVASLPDIEPQTLSMDQPSLVINAGIGGNNTRDLLARIEKDCLQHNPDLTILMVGTNDMNSMKHVPLEEYTSNYQTLVEKLLKIKSKILVMSILPVYEPYLFTRHPVQFYAPDGPALRRSKVNEVIHRISEQKNLSFLDMHHIFEKTGEIGLSAMSLLKNEINSGKTDGVHPTADGYRVMAVAVYQYITLKGLPHNKVVCFGDSITMGDADGQNYPTYLQKLLNS